MWKRDSNAWAEHRVVFSGTIHRLVGCYDYVLPGAIDFLNLSPRVQVTCPTPCWARWGYNHCWLRLSWHNATLPSLNNAQIRLSRCIWTRRSRLWIMEMTWLATCDVVARLSTTRFCWFQGLDLRLWFKLRELHHDYDYLKIFKAAPECHLDSMWARSRH